MTAQKSRQWLQALHWPYIGKAFEKGMFSSSYLLTSASKIKVKISKDFVSDKFINLGLGFRDSHPQNWKSSSIQNEYCQSVQQISRTVLVDSYFFSPSIWCSLSMALKKQNNILYFCNLFNKKCKYIGNSFLQTTFNKITHTTLSRVTCHQWCKAFPSLGCVLPRWLSQGDRFKSDLNGLMGAKGIWSKWW